MENEPQNFLFEKCRTWTESDLGCAVRNSELHFLEIAQKWHTAFEANEKTDCVSREFLTDMLEMLRIIDDIAQLAYANASGAHWRLDSIGGGFRY